MQWSRYQTAIFAEAARRTGDDCAIVARAGAAKTTSLIEALTHVPHQRVLLCAFNKAIQAELSRRAPPHVQTRTFHAIGLRVCHQNAARCGRNVTVDTDKARRQVFALMKEKRHYWLPPNGADDFRLMTEMATNVRKTASYAKNVMADDHAALVDIANQLDLPDRRAADNVARAAADLMERAAAEPYAVDFDDMLWLPLKLRYDVPSFPVVMTDETQDMCPAQYRLVDAMRRGGRVIGAADPRQCIYGFRGADRQAVEAFVNHSPVRLPLPICYRCPTSVIERARTIVPDIEAAPDAPEGNVRLVEFDEAIDEAAPGDFILSRTNAPLMTTCLRLLRLDRPAVIAGRDLGQSLGRLVDRAKATTRNELSVWLAEWLMAEHERHVPEHPERYERSHDRVACLQALMSHCRTVADVRERLSRMFVDDDPGNQIVCSTVHKAKGLERDRVWMLHDTFGHPNPKAWQDRWSEENVWYVAVTRARRELCFVETPVSEIMPSRGGSAMSSRPARKRNVTWRS